MSAICFDYSEVVCNYMAEINPACPGSRVWVDVRAWGSCACSVKILLECCLAKRRVSMTW